MSEEKELFEWVKAAHELPEIKDCDSNTRIHVKRINNGYNDCLPIVFLTIHRALYEWLKPIPQSKISEQIAGYVHEIDSLLETNRKLGEKLSSLTPKSIRDSDELSWEQLRDLWESKTKIPSAERGIISLEQFIIGYEEGLKAKSASLKPNKLSDAEIEKMAEEHGAQYHGDFSDNHTEEIACSSFIEGWKAKEKYTQNPHS